MTTFTRFITDCADPNASLRLGLQGEVLFGVTPQVVPVGSEIEAAGLLVDALDVCSGIPGIIFVNIAPRNGDAAKWENGVPFGHFSVGLTHVITTIGAKTLSLVAKLGLVKTVNVLDIPTVSEWAVARFLINGNEAKELRTTQFRSLRFAPTVGNWITRRNDVPSTETPIDDLVPHSLSREHRVWFEDCFGNLKTTRVARGLPARIGLEDRIGEVRFRERLKDVPDDGEPTWIVGSSGYGDCRFLELVVQGASAADALKLKAGDKIPNRY